MQPDSPIRVNINNAEDENDEVMQDDGGSDNNGSASNEEVTVQHSVIIFLT